MANSCDWLFNYHATTGLTAVLVADDYVATGAALTVMALVSNIGVWNFQMLIASANRWPTHDS